jgi:uncharacterized protein (TIGR02246 family)
MRQKIMTSRTGRFASLLLGVFLLAQIPVAHAAAPKQGELLEAATKLGAQYDANYALQDPNAMAALYAPDGTLVSPAGNIIHGHDALVNYYRSRFANGAVKHHIEMQELHVQGNGGYGVAHITIQSKDASGGLRTETGNLVAVFLKSADGWHFCLIEPSIPPKSRS